MASKSILNFKVGKEYTGFYEESKKKCKIKIIKITAQETTLEVSTLPNRLAKLPTNRIFSIGKDGVEVLRFYNTYKSIDFKIDYIVAYADGRTEKDETDALNKFIVGNSYYGEMHLPLDVKQFEVKCISRTKKYAEFEWRAKIGGTEKKLVGKMFIKIYMDTEYGTIKTKGCYDIHVPWDSVEYGNSLDKKHKHLF